MAKIKVEFRGIAGGELRPGDALTVESCENGVLILEQAETLLNPATDSDAEVAKLLDEADAAHEGGDADPDAETPKKKRGRK